MKKKFRPFPITTWLPLVGIFFLSLSPSPAAALDFEEAEQVLEELEQYWEDIYIPYVEPTPTLDQELLGKGAPDGCFYTVGDERNYYDPDLELPCPDGGS